MRLATGCWLNVAVMTSLPDRKSPFLFIVRPEAEAEKDCRALADHNIAAYPLPVLKTTKLAALNTPPPGEAQAVIYTSKQAVHPVHASLATAYCVGAATASAARAAGFQNLHHGQGNGAELAAEIVNKANPSAGPLYWPHGVDISFDIAHALRQDGFDVEAVPVYHMAPVAAIPQTTAEIIRQQQHSFGFMVMSARHLQVLEQLLVAADLWQHIENAQLLLLSADIAAEARLDWKHFHIASHADRAAMMALCLDFAQAAG